MKRFFVLSRKERELMEIFWDNERPLARTEILDLAAQRPQTWKPSSLYILLDALMKKGAVQVEGFYLNSRKLGRLFQAAITKEDYSYMQISKAAHEAQQAGYNIVCVLPRLLGNDLQALEEAGQYVQSLQNKKAGKPH